ncbi:MAG: Chorismate synthase [Nitrospira sp.]|jgi:chorismate synthase|nr:MAG: Chorismate synthase [Nitrospira sp.]
MAGNTFGRIFTVTSFGESHGPAIGCVVDGCPPGLVLSSEDIQHDLDRRKPGTSRHVTQRQESDTVEILSGLFEGKTTGTPIALLIRNEDARSRDYGNLVETFRPGHADYTYWQKYGIRDHRGGGRASARETAVRVAAAAIARKWLCERYGVLIRGYLSQLGPIEVPFQRWDAVGTNPFFSANADMVGTLESFMDELRKTGDSVGAKITTVAEQVPVGWGAPVYAKLDADLAAAMMGINAVKAVEIGSGFGSVTQRGSEHSDELTPEGFVTNHAGGILGGISSGQDIVVTIGIKPTSSIRIARRSIDKQGNPTTVETNGRHDPCVGIRATPIAEAMMALVLMDHALLHRAQNADVTTKTPKIAGSLTGAPSSRTQKPASTIDPDPTEA